MVIDLEREAFKCREQVKQSWRRLKSSLSSAEDKVRLMMR